MALSKAHRTSDKQHYETPRLFLKLIERLLGVVFTIDFAASKENHLCPYYYTKEINAFMGDWAVPPAPEGKISAGWCNPPYGDKKFPVAAWVNSTFAHCDKFNYCHLLPMNKMDQDWFHFLLDGIRLGIVKGRIQYTIDGEIPLRWDEKLKKWTKSGNSQGSIIIAFGPNIPNGIFSIPWRDEINLRKKQFEICSDCNGTGTIYTHSDCQECGTCGGEGYIL